MITIALTAPRLAKFAGNPDVSVLDAAIATAKGGAGNVGLSLSGNTLTVHDNAGLGLVAADVNAAIDAWAPAPAATAFDTPKAALDAWRTAIVTDTAALTSGRAGVAALNPASVVAIATAVTYLTAQKAALLAEIDALHATLNDVKAAVNALADVVATLKARG